MSQNLINAIRKARQTRVTVGKYTFTVRRLTTLEYLRYRDSGTKYIPVEDLYKFVIDWSGVTGIDLASSGDGDPVPFNADLFMAWVVDYPDIWTTIILGVVDSFKKWNDDQVNDAKN